MDCDYLFFLVKDGTCTACFFSYYSLILFSTPWSCSYILNSIHGHRRLISSIIIIIIVFTKMMTIIIIRIIILLLLLRLFSNHVHVTNFGCITDRSKNVRKSCLLHIEHIAGEDQQMHELPAARPDGGRAGAVRNHGDLPNHVAGAQFVTLQGLIEGDQLLMQPFLVRFFSLAGCATETVDHRSDASTSTRTILIVIMMITVSTTITTTATRSG